MSWNTKYKWQIQIPKYENKSQSSRAIYQSITRSQAILAPEVKLRKGEWIYCILVLFPDWASPLAPVLPETYPNRRGYNYKCIQTKVNQISFSLKISQRNYRSLSNLTCSNFLFVSGFSVKIWDKFLHILHLWVHSSLWLGWWDPQITSFQQSYSELPPRLLHSTCNTVVKGEIGEKQNWDKSE